MRQRNEIELAKKIIHQKHAALAGLRNLSNRYRGLHREIHDVLSRNGSIGEAEYRKLYQKAMEGWKFPEAEPGEEGKNAGET